ncbi:hypothetical protein GIB67_023653 [Kingdonia uniflora]|uniref:Uncharacterized protein n=1 Tax=Kingdonia uniflora TaxID=39325 RepID=A0A7J7NSU8_9MAGN|nr:hypothetical protein GIB67_023653 [Kingdonia uniflora]
MVTSYLIMFIGAEIPDSKSESVMALIQIKVSKGGSKLCDMVRSSICFSVSMIDVPFFKDIKNPMDMSHYTPCWPRSFTLPMDNINNKLRVTSEDNFSFRGCISKKKTKHNSLQLMHCNILRSHSPVHADLAMPM